MQVKEIQNALAGWLRFCSQGSIILPNVYVGGSYWESDMVEVKKSGLWYEFEIKLSVADYRADFNKQQFGYCGLGMSKHDAYSSDAPIMHGTTKQIPKPKQFFFVVPTGLLDGQDVPEHCGVIEVSGDALERRRGYGVTLKRVPRILKPPTKLGPKEIFNLAAKASARIRFC